MTDNTKRKANEWIWLPGELLGGRYVSAERINKDGRLFSVCDTAKMGIEAFNTDAEEHRIKIAEGDTLLDRFVKIALLDAKRSRDGSHIPTNKEQIEIILYALKWMLGEPYKSLYNTIMTGPLDVVRDVLEFNGGPYNDRYDVIVHRYDGDGNLNHVREMNIPGSGVIITLDDDYYFPTETHVLKTAGHAAGMAKNERPEDYPIEHPACFRDRGVSGYFEFTGEPEIGQQYLVRHATNKTYPINIHLLNMRHLPSQTSAFRIRSGNR